MRVEGRTPNYEVSTYRVNFSGSFAAATDLPQPPEDAEPKVSDKTSTEAVARVNSAGAIIEDLTAKKQPEPTQPESEKAATEPEKAAEEKTAETTAASATRRPARTARTTPARRTTRSGRRTTTPQPAESAPAVTEANTAESTPETSAAPRPAARTARNAATRRSGRNQPAKTETAEPKANPLANIRLVVLLKDGYKIERPMSEVLRASVDKGTLVVITKDGKIERFAILDVLKFSIEQ